MGFPAEIKLGTDGVFTVNTHDPATAESIDADSVPTYRVYEEETETPILTGSMAKLDDANTIGFYSESIAVTTGTGFESNKTYNIMIHATVVGITGAISFGFRVMPAVDNEDLEAIVLDIQDIVKNRAEVVIEGGVAKLKIYDDAGTSVIYTYSLLDADGNNITSAADLGDGPSRRSNPI